MQYSSHIQLTRISPEVTHLRTVNVFDDSEVARETSIRKTVQEVDC